MKAATREALRAIAEKGLYGMVSFTQEEAKALLARESAPDLVTRMDLRVPALLENVERGRDGLCASDAQVLAGEIRRLRVERDRMYWATQAAVRRLEDMSRNDPEDPWNEVTRG